MVCKDRTAELYCIMLELNTEKEGCMSYIYNGVYMTYIPTFEAFN